MGRTCEIRITIRLLHPPSKVRRCDGLSRYLSRKHSEICLLKERLIHGKIHCCVLDLHAKPSDSHRLSTIITLFPIGHTEHSNTLDIHSLPGQLCTTGTISTLANAPDSTSTSQQLTRTEVTDQLND